MCLPDAVSPRCVQCNSNVVSSVPHSTVRGSPGELGKGHSGPLLTHSRRSLLMLSISPTEIETHHLLKVTPFLPLTCQE